jgi:hypothetical protein
MRGIDDPEFCCTQNLKTKSWIVRKRKFPLDQTVRHEQPLPLKSEPIVVEEKKEEPPKEPKKEDLELSWANMAASKNDGLTKQLAELSSKFDQLAEKYEEKKKAKAIKAKPKKEPPVKPNKLEEYEYYSDDEPPYPLPPQGRPATAPRQTPPPMQQQRQLPQRLPMGKYIRSGPISISQF